MYLYWNTSCTERFQCVETGLKTSWVHLRLDVKPIVSYPRLPYSTEGSQIDHLPGIMTLIHQCEIFRPVWCSKIKRLFHRTYEHTKIHHSKRVFIRIEKCSFSHKWNVFWIHQFHRRARQQINGSLIRMNLWRMQALLIVRARSQIWSGINEQLKAVKKTLIQINIYPWISLDF